MKARDLLRLAVLGLRRRPTRTLLTGAGLCVAITAMVVFLSLGEGLKRVFTEQFRSVGPDIQLSLSGAGSGLLPPPNLQESLEASVVAAARPLGATQVTPVVTILKPAFDPSQSAVYYGLPARLGLGALFAGLTAAQGRTFTAGDEGQPVAVLGRSAARNAGVRVGDTLSVLGTDVRVIGILAAGHGLSDTFTFLPLRTLQRAAGQPRQVSLFAVTLRDPARASQAAAQLGERLNLVGQTRGEVLAVADRALRVTRAAQFGLSLVALLVGALSVTNTVAMSVAERTREFGTLRALGARSSLLGLLVVTETLLLTVIAGVVGLAWGWLGAAGVNLYTRQLAGIDGAAVTPGVAGVALGVSLLLGVAAALIPARLAARVPIHQTQR